MLNLVYCEMLKLKRCKIVSFSVLGVMATPLLMFVEALQTHFKHPEQMFTLADIYDSSLLYVMLLMNMMVYVAITAYLFSREYAEKTLKNLLPIPVSRTALISGKFVTLFIWTMLLTIVTWAAIFMLSAVYHGAFGMNGFNVAIGGEWLLKFLLGSVLLFFTISPFAYIAEKTKGFVIPIIISSAIVMGSAALSNQELGALYPWTATYFLVQGKLQATGYPVTLSIGIVAAVSILGFYLTVRYFRREDIK